MSRNRDRWSTDHMPSGEEMAQIQAGIDATMRQIISSPRISQSASMIPDRMRAEETPRATSSETPITSPPGVDLIDRMVQAQDRKDRLAAIQQATENAWIESHFEKGPQIETEYNPFDKRNMSK